MLAPGDKARQEFMAGWDWERIYGYWREQIDSLNFGWLVIFLELEVQFSPRRLSYVSEADRHLFLWAEKDPLHPEYLTLDRLREEIRTGAYWPYDWKGRRGEQDTLANLWRLRKDQEAQAGVLLAGSLFERIGSSRATYPKDLWPYITAGKALYHLVRQEMEKNERFRPWHYSCTDVFPWSKRDDAPRPRMETMEELLFYLAEEHIETFLRYQPVLVVCKEREEEDGEG